MAVSIRSLSLLLTLASSLGAQQPEPCPDGRAPGGDLGIARLQCVGSGATCTIGVQRSRDEYSHRFSVEPVVTQVKERVASPTPAVRDIIVAIDSLLITTAAAGRHFANLTPGETVRLLVRRDGQLRELRLVAGRGCGVTGLSVRSAAPR